MFSDPNRGDKTCPLSSTDGVIVVSYFLPVIVTRAAGKSWVVQWNDEALLARTHFLRVSWIGSIPRKISLTPQDEEIISALLLEMSCYPIYLSREAHRNFYNIFCKEHLWPVLHHSCDPYGPIDKKKLDHQHERMLWYICTKIQELFSRKVVEIYQRGDIVWIHGFHFMILPSYLRRKISDALIGIFLHTPFPSSEIWKTLWCREDLLAGLLCANQIGFHLYEYARHFLTTCRRLLGAHYEYSTSGSITIQTGGRIAFVTCFHVGTNNCLIEKTLKKDTFLTRSTLLFEKHSGKIVITSK
jgi:trehalose 6-phosphate synthase/phosphatase